MKKSSILIVFLALITIFMIVFGEQQFKNAGKSFTDDSTEEVTKKKKKDSKPKKEKVEKEEKKPKVKPLAVFTFDDGADSDYHTVVPLLQPYDITATSYLVGNWVGSESFLSLDQIAEMNNNGWDFQDHTLGHLDLNELSMDDAAYQISQNGAFLESINVGSPAHLGLPTADISSEMRDLFAEDRQTIRNLESGSTEIYNTWDEIDLTNLQAINISTHDIDQVIASIDEAIAANAIMIFAGNRIGEEEHRTPEELLEIIVDHIVENEVETATISEMYEKVINYQEEMADN